MNLDTPYFNALTQKIIVAINFCALSITFCFFSGPLLAPRLQIAPHDELGLLWKECTLPGVNGQ